MQMQSGICWTGRIPRRQHKSMQSLLAVGMLSSLHRAVRKLCPALLVPFASSGVQMHRCWLVETSRDLLGCCQSTLIAREKQSWVMHSLHRCLDAWSGCHHVHDSAVKHIGRPFTTAHTCIAGLLASLLVLVMGRLVTSVQKSSQVCFLCVQGLARNGHVTMTSISKMAASGHSCRGRGHSNMIEHFW